MGENFNAIYCAFQVKLAVEVLQTLVALLTTLRNFRWHCMSVTFICKNASVETRHIGSHTAFLSPLGPIPKVAGEERGLPLY